MAGAGISALSPTVGLSGLPDPLGDATAALEARRRQQVTGAGYDPDKGLYDRYSEMLSFLGPTIAERSRAAADAMRRGDMATYQKIATDLSMDFGNFLGSIKPIRAYHGSPHDFDKFSMDKIGSGEGAQAFGHGLYFAESEKVARSYKNGLTGRGWTVPMTLDGRPVTRRNWSDIQREMWARGDREGAFLAQMLGDANMYNIKTMGALKKAYKDRHGPLFPWDSPFGNPNRDAHAIDDAFRALRERAQFAPPRGRMYEVDIHADPGRMLDLDSPLSKQAPDVRDAAMKAITRGTDDAARASGMRGADVASWAANSAEPIGMFPTAYKGRTFSEVAREAGIPGIKYLDQGSRAAGDGSRNYVVFDDKLIEILRKYGIMAPMAGAGIGSLYMNDEEGM